MKWSVFKGTQIDSPRVAFALILTALFFLSLQDGLVKFASATSSNPKAVIFRTAAIMGTMIFFFSGAPFLTLPEMGAGLYTYPIFMTVLSMIFLREKVGVWRLLAIILAATGAILIIRPSSQSFHAAQILPIFAGFFYSINAIILRKYCRDESPERMAELDHNHSWPRRILRDLQCHGQCVDREGLSKRRTQWPCTGRLQLPNLRDVLGLCFLQRPTKYADSGPRPLNASTIKSMNARVLGWV